jgi:hypothetical protein
MKIKKPTNLQFRFMTKIIENECTQYNGNALELLAESNPNATATWADQIIETPADNGTFVSLMNAGLIWYAQATNESTVGLTDAGLLVMKEYYGKWS